MSPEWLAGLALTGLVGASLGLLGAGGSIVMLPVLVYVMGVDPHAAVPLSLVIVGTTSLVSIATHWRDGEIQWSTALLLGGVGLGGNYVGSGLTARVPGATLMLLFGLVLAIVGVRMWRAPDGGDTDPARERRPWLIATAGAFVGLLTGFLGVGGGFLIVPALVRAGGLGMCQATRTSLVVIAMSSAAAFMAHLARGSGVSASLAVPLVIAASVGMMAGSQAGRRIGAEHLRLTFAGFVTIVGLVLILVNAPAALPAGGARAGGGGFESMLTALQEPWPWYVSGPLIGLMVPLLLLVGGKAFGISSNLRHLCAATVPGGIPFFKYDWKREGGWNLLFALGIVIGGFVAASLLTPSGYTVAIAAATRADLRALGLRDVSGLVPQELMGWNALASARGWLTLVAGGFLVGFGTRWAGGCTSGHAISGLATFQLPSLIAVVGFFAGGLLMTHLLMPYLF